MHLQQCCQCFENLMIRGLKVSIAYVRWHSNSYGKALLQSLRFVGSLSLSLCMCLFILDTQELSARWAFVGMQLVPTHVVFGFADPNLLASSCSASLELSLSFVQTISNFALPQSECYFLASYAIHMPFLVWLCWFSWVFCSQNDHHLLSQLPKGYVLYFFHSWILELDMFSQQLYLFPRFCKTPQAQEHHTTNHHQTKI